jgi:hypothetical protein
MDPALPRPHCFYLWCAGRHTLGRCPEFLFEAFDLLARAADIQTTTTLAHNARGNDTIELFWRFWNRRLRLLSDDHYVRCMAFVPVAHHLCLQHCCPRKPRRGHPLRGVPRCPHPQPLPYPGTALVNAPDIDEDKKLCLPVEFPAAVAVSTRVFGQLAESHDQFVREETAARLNEKGNAKTFKIGDKVKVRVPPTAAQMEETGRRAKHITAWRGRRTVVEEHLSQTAYAAVDDFSNRRARDFKSATLPG